VYHFGGRMARGAPPPGLVRVAKPADDACADASLRRKAHPDVGVAPDRVRRMTRPRDTARTSA
jgi:hypothetical protein